MDSKVRNGLGMLGYNPKGESIGVGTPSHAGRFFGVSFEDGMKIRDRPKTMSPSERVDYITRLSKK